MAARSSAARRTASATDVSACTASVIATARTTGAAPGPSLPFKIVNAGKTLPSTNFTPRVAEKEASPPVMPLKRLTAWFAVTYCERILPGNDMSRNAGFLRLALLLAALASLPDPARADRARERARSGEERAGGRLVYRDEHPRRRTGQKAVRGKIPVPEPDHPAPAGRKDPHAHPDRNARRQVLLGRGFVQSPRHGRAEPGGIARFLRLPGNPERLSEGRGRPRGPLGGDLRAAIRHRLQHAIGAEVRGAEELAGPAAGEMEGKIRHGRERSRMVRGDARLSRRGKRPRFHARAGAAEPPAAPRPQPAVEAPGRGRFSSRSSARGGDGGSQKNRRARGLGDDSRSDRDLAQPGRGIVQGAPSPCRPPVRRFPAVRAGPDPHPRARARTRPR